MHNEQTVNKIREFILQQFPLAKKRALKDADDLLETGVIDSMGVLEIVTFLEKEFSVAVTDEELIPENFRSIEAIARFVAPAAAASKHST